MEIRDEFEKITVVQSTRQLLRKSSYSFRRINRDGFSNSSNPKYRAKTVAKDFLQKYRVDFDEVFSHVVKTPTPFSPWSSRFRGHGASLTKI